MSALNVEEIIPIIYGIGAHIKSDSGCGSKGI
jgi:hypothetical protein